MPRFSTAPPMRSSPALLAACLLTALAGCGGGSGDGGRRDAFSACGETARKQWVLDVTRDWYLFQETLPATVDLSSYATAEDLLDALTATARAQGKDRFFSYLTTRSAENSLLGEGEFVGFGFRNRTDDPHRIFVVDVYAGSPAAEAGLQRGDEVIAVDGASVADALASGDRAFSDLLGPAEAGVRRTLTIRRDGSTFDATLQKRTVTIDPVPDDFGATVLPLTGTTGVGYLHLRSYTATADAQLRSAFANFRSQGIDHFVIDLRYNGGGFVSTAELLNDLLGGGRTGADVQFSLVHNPARSNQDSTTRFQPQPESVSPVQVAFLTTEATASASEINANTLWPYLTTAIVGSDTLGKPVGQVAFDLPGCDDRLRLVAFKAVNSLGEGDYYDGLASVMPYACAAPDTLAAPLGSAGDDMIAAALAWFDTGACAPMGAATGGRLKPFGAGPGAYPRPRQPSPAEHWLPGIQ